MARPSAHKVHPREMVLAALKAAKLPMSAYRLLEELKPLGIKSAPIVYRALKELETAHDVHRIHTISAYVACNCSENHDHALSVLTICEQCQSVEELHNHAVLHHLEALRALKVNLPQRAVIELPVLCKLCA